MQGVLIVCKSKCFAMELFNLHHQRIIFRKGPSKFERCCITSCIACCPCCFSQTMSERDDLEERTGDKKRFPFLPQFRFKATKIGGGEHDDKVKRLGFFGKHPIVDVTRISKREEIEDSPVPKRKDESEGSSRGLIGDMFFNTLNSSESLNDESKSDVEAPERLKAPAVIRSQSNSLPATGKLTPPENEEEGDIQRRKSAEDIPLAIKITNFFELRRDDTSFVIFNEETNKYENKYERKHDHTLSRSGKPSKRL